MTFHFKEAIALQTIRKLKSHAKVGYQDHPNGDKRCSGCSMYRPDINPDSPCTHVAPPVAAHGYCDDYEALDPNARARAAIGKGKSFIEVMKDGPADEARDERGRWSTGSGASGGTTRRSGRVSDKLSTRTTSRYLDAELRREERQAAREDKQMREAQQKVDDLQRQLSEHSQDKSEDLYWGIHRLYQQAVADLHTLHEEIFGKAYNPDEPRDEKGRWTAGDSPGHPDWMHGDEGQHLASAMEDVPKGINESADHIEEARQALEDSSATASDHSEEEPDSGTKEYAAWEKQNNANLNDVADKTMALHQALVDHMDATASVLSQFRSKIDTHAKENGVRVGKNMTVGDVHATTALGNQPPNKRKAKDFLTTIGEVKGGARIMAMPDIGKAGPDDEARDEHGRWTGGGAETHRNFAEQSDAFRLGFGSKPNADNPFKDRPPLATAWQRGHDKKHGTSKRGMDFGKALEKIKADALAGVSTYKWSFDNRFLLSDNHYVDIVKGRTVNVLFMRHGPTRFNNQTDMSKDRVRSWNNVPLTADGIEDAEKAGEKLKDEGIGYIVSSDLGRAIQTSKLVGKAVGVKPVHEYGMRPWNLGKFTGMSTDEAHDGIMHYVENPDEVVDGGESFNTFKARAAQAMLSHIKKASGKKMLVVSHHRNERLFAAMQPDGTVDAKKFMKTGEDPGDVTEMEFSTDELQNALRSAKESRGKENVGKVWGSNSELPDAVRGALPQEAQTVWRRVANGRIKAGQSEESAIRQAWTAVKNGWSKTKDGWVRKHWLGSDGVHEFLEAELAKAGDVSSIAKPTDNINVSLQLIPLDDQNARSPFPYDQYFFSDLRNDQKERVLAALTDQDSLEERDIPLSSLSAVQDRVDPGKIQSMIEGAPEKFAVVVRIAPGRYCIVDGHHRLTAAKLSGVKTVHVKYLDIEAYDPRVHTDDNPGAKGEPVNKSSDDWEQQFVISKVDEEQMKVYGWASVTQVGDEIILDKQDDIIPDDELEKAAHDYVLYHRQQGDMHERMGVGRICESALYNQERWDLGFRAYDDETGLKKFGWFVVFKVDDPGVWKRIKAGDLPEFSIGGKARREAVET